MPQKLSSRAQRGILRQCRQIPRCARDDDVAFAFGDQAMRPAPLLVVAFVAWTALGVVTLFVWLPLHAWPMAVVASADGGLRDLLRLSRSGKSDVVRELAEGLPIEMGRGSGGERGWK